MTSEFDKALQRDRLGAALYVILGICFLIFGAAGMWVAAAWWLVRLPGLPVVQTTGEVALAGVDHFHSRYEPNGHDEPFVLYCYRVAGAWHEGAIYHIDWADNAGLHQPGTPLEVTNSAWYPDASRTASIRTRCWGFPSWYR